MGYEHVKASRDRRKKEIVETMGDKCQICGYNNCDAALELHHIDPSQKEFTFDKQLNTAWSKLENELKKCVLLCANCHREVHFSGKIFNLEPSFNKEAFLKISNRVEQMKNGKFNYCKKCRTIIPKGSKFCPNCNHKNGRKGEIPCRESLKQMIRTLPFTTIGSNYNVTDNAVRKWCKNYNLPSTKKEISLISNEDWEVL